MKRNAPVYALLLLLEAVIVFGLGVFGNKVAELLRVSAGFVVVGALITIVALYLLTLTRLRFEVGEPLVPHLPEDTARAELINKVFTGFPVALFVGIMFGLLSDFLLPGREINARIAYVHEYEIVTFICAIAILIFISKRTREVLLSIVGALGLSMGASFTHVLLMPRENVALQTFAYTMTICIVAGWALSSKPLLSLMDSVAKNLQPKNA